LRELLRDGSACPEGDTDPKVSVCGDRGESGTLVVGLVPARFLDETSCETAAVVTMKGGLRSWAADDEGRRRRRGVTDPRTPGKEAMLSPFADGLEEIGVLPGCAAGEGNSTVLTSVDPLPLRFRRRYASIALASCSRTRDAIGDSADAGLEYEKVGVGEEAENVLVLPDEDAPERYVLEEDESPLLYE
jgi:hypothetical protein